MSHTYKKPVDVLVELGLVTHTSHKTRGAFFSRKTLKVPSTDDDISYTLQGAVLYACTVISTAAIDGALMFNSRTCASISDFFSETRGMLKSAIESDIPVDLRDATRGMFLALSPKQSMFSAPDSISGLLIEPPFTRLPGSSSPQLRIDMRGFTFSKIARVWDGCVIYSADASNADLSNIHAPRGSFFRYCKLDNARIENSFLSYYNFNASSLNGAHIARSMLIVPTDVDFADIFKDVTFESTVLFTEEKEVGPPHSLTPKQLQQVFCTWDPPRDRDMTQFAFALPWISRHKGSYRIHFDGANFQGVTFSASARFNNFSFKNCDFRGILATDINLTFTRCDLSGALFDRLQLRDLEFEHCTISGASFTGIHASVLLLTTSSVEHTDFSDITADVVSIKGSTLRRVSLERADIGRLMLSEASLRDSELARLPSRHLLWLKVNACRNSPQCIKAAHGSLLPAQAFAYGPSDWGDYTRTVVVMLLLTRFADARIGSITAERFFPLPLNYVGFPDDGAPASFSAYSIPSELPAQYL